MNVPVVIVLLGILQVTSYRPVPEQTKVECIDRDRCRTSIDDGITKYGVAVSQDLLKSGKVHYGDALYIDGYGIKIVNDTMNPRIKKAVDMLVLTRGDEKAVGVRHLKVWIIKKEE